jgi:dTDP-4-dehydrorhamnose 3,5-epimerase
MTSHLKLVKISTAIRGVFVLEPKIFGDERGWFMESFNAQDFASAIDQDYEFVQDNHSFSKQWTLRGIHYQTDKSQGKLVRVIKGSIFDVVVDLRQDSPTYGNWDGMELSANSLKQIWMPPGLAHGFLVLTPMAEVLYKTTDYYDPQSEVCLAWNDPTIGIQWPFPEGISPDMSAKDLAGLSWHQVPKF